MTRQAIIDEALTWLRTPWHHQGSIKGVGVDCGYFLREVYANCGLIQRLPIPPYPRDWAMHKTEERFLATVKQYAYETTQALPGDIAVFKFGNAFSHGAIVINWPEIIHSQVDCGVVLARADDGELINRAVKFFTVF